MKQIKCDRCGKDIPYIPAFMNFAQQKPMINVTIWDDINNQIQEVDLCVDCKKAVYKCIFDYSNGT